MIRIVIIVLWMGLGYKCIACKCNDPGSVKESFKRKGIIIRAKVIGVDTVSYSGTLLESEAKQVERELSNDPQRLAMFTSKSIFKVKVLVMERFKGQNILDTVSIYTPMFGRSCGYKFQLEKEYIIYGSGRGFYSTFFYDRKVEKEHTYWTNHCTRTKLFDESEAKELRTLKN